MLNNPTFQFNSYGLPLGVYCSIIHTYLTPPAYLLHSLQGQFPGFQDFTFLFNSKRVVHSCTFVGNISQIFGPKYNMLLKPLRSLISWYLKKEFVS